MLARTADNLFWLARYVERAEFTARIIDITARLAALPKAYGGGAEWESALSAVGSLERFKETYEKADEPSVIEFLIFDPANPSSIRSCIESARTNARAVRTALTADMWQCINAAWLELRSMERARAPFERMNATQTQTRRRYQVHARSPRNRAIHLKYTCCINRGICPDLIQQGGFVGPRCLS